MATKKPTSKKTTAKAAPKKAAPKKATPKKSTAKKSTPKKTSPKAATKTTSSSTTSSAKQKNISWAIVAYFVFFLPLLVDTAKNDVFVRYHMSQGCGLLAFALIGSLVSTIPFLGWLVSGVIWLLTLAFLIIGIINASESKKEPLPLIGVYAEKYLKF